MKALIIHSRRTGYGVIRSLHNIGVEVIVADDEATPVFKSNKVSHAYVLPNITTVSESRFIDALLEIGENHFDREKILVFTGKDDYLLFFSKNYNALSKYFVLSFESDYEKLTSVLSKKQLINIAEAVSVFVPRTLTDESFEGDFDSLSYPVIIKPDLKNTPNQDVVKTAFRLKFCENKNELNDARAQLINLKVEYVVQEYIPGGDDDLYTVGVYFYEGRLLGYSMARKIRQFPVQTGECSFGELIDDDSLIDSCILLGKESRITGICQIEFKKHAEKYYLIEINPRVWSWHQIHTLAGVDFVKICCDKIFFKKEEKLISPKPNVKGYWHFSSMDLLHNVLLNKNISLLTWVRDAWRAEIHAFFTKEDLKPFLIHWISTIPYIFSSLKTKR